MYTLDDPLLALILRFVGRSQKVTLRDDEFLHDQVGAIRKHIAAFPPEHRKSRALEWVERHAREYRARWAKATVGEIFSDQQCVDCPLAESGPAETCQIHQAWLELLRSYVANEISTKAYVEDSLDLLARHKRKLEVSRGLARLGL